VATTSFNVLNEQPLGSEPLDLRGVAQACLISLTQSSKVALAAAEDVTFLVQN
jgi:hypothetical protein